MYMETIPETVEEVEERAALAEAMLRDVAKMLRTGRLAPDHPVMVRYRRAENIAAYWAGHLSGLRDGVEMVTGGPVEEVATSLPLGAKVEGVLVLDAEAHARLMRMLPALEECAAHAEAAEAEADRLRVAMLRAHRNRAALVELVAAAVAVLETLAEAELPTATEDPPPREKRSHASPMTTCHASTAPPRGRRCRIHPSVRLGSSGPPG